MSSIGGSPPREAIAALEGGLVRQLAVRAICAGLRDEVVRTAANLMVARRDDHEERFTRLVMPPNSWADSQPGPDIAFWWTGQIDLVIRFPRDADIEIACHGVRFDPAHIRELLKNAGGVPRAKESISEAQQAKNLENWGAWLAKLQPALELAASNAAKLRTDSPKTRGLLGKQRPNLRPVSLEHGVSSLHLQLGVPEIHEHADAEPRGAGPCYGHRHCRCAGL